MDAAAAAVGALVVLPARGRRVARDRAGAGHREPAEADTDAAPFARPVRPGLVTVDGAALVHRERAVLAVPAPIQDTRTPGRPVALDGAAVVHPYRAAIVAHPAGTRFTGLVAADRAGVVHLDRAGPPVADPSGPVVVRPVVAADRARVVHDERPVVHDATVRLGHAAADGAAAVHDEDTVVRDATHVDPVVAVDRAGAVQHERAVVVHATGSGVAPAVSDPTGAVEPERAGVDDGTRGREPTRDIAVAVDEDIAERQRATVHDVAAAGPGAGVATHDDDVAQLDPRALFDDEDTDLPDTRERGLARCLRARARDDQARADDRPPNAGALDRETVTLARGIDRHLEGRVGLARGAVLDATGRW